MRTPCGMKREGMDGWNEKKINPRERSVVGKIGHTQVLIGNHATTGKQRDENEILPTHLKHVVRAHESVVVEIKELIQQINLLLGRPEREHGGQGDELRRVHVVRASKVDDRPQVVEHVGGHAEGALRYLMGVRASVGAQRWRGTRHNHTYKHEMKR
jgi:hypothetical protein